MDRGYDAPKVVGARDQQNHTGEPTEPNYLVCPLGIYMTDDLMLLHMSFSPNWTLQYIHCGKCCDNMSSQQTTCSATSVIITLAHGLAHMIWTGCFETCVKTAFTEKTII